MKESSGKEPPQGLIEYALVFVLVLVIFVIVLVLLGPSLGETLANMLDMLAPGGVVGGV